MILTTARPSKRYRNYRSIADLILQARLVNGRVVYYETHLGDTQGREWTVRVKEETVRSMFPTGKRIKDQPFRVQENKDFHIVLNRHRTRFKEPYQKLVDGKPSSTPKIKRTKKVKRTKIKRTNHNIPEIK